MSSMSKTQPKSKVFVAIAITVACALVLPSPVNAVISGTSGQVTKIAPPASVGRSAGLASLTTNWAWDEQQGVTLASNLTADITQLGSYELQSGLSTGTIQAGTTVDSHFFDAVRPNNSGTTVLTSTLTFAADIVGIMVLRGRLLNSNLLGSPTTDYSTGTSVTNDLELGAAGDGVFFTSLRTVTIRTSTGNDFDQVRILTRHDAPPVANAGGPYSAGENGTIGLLGAASDPEGSTIQKSWTFNVAAPVGTVCTPAATNTLNPTVTCNDDAVVTATLSVTDGFHAPVTSSATLTFNNVAPTVATPTGPTGQIPITTPVAINVAFSDASPRDTHTATVEWGDTTSDNVVVTETNGAGSLNATHIYANRGHYTVTVTVRDDDGGLTTRNIGVDVNGPPTASAGGPFAGAEGATTSLTGTANDPDADNLVTTWTLTPTLSDPGTSCVTTDVATLTPNITCDDEAVVAAQLTVDDGVNAAVVANTTVAIANADPVLGSVAVTAGPIPVGSLVAVSAPFSDPGTHDTHTATINWGDLTSSNATLTEAQGAGAFASGHAYSQAGLYTITVTLTDDNGGTAVSTTQILVNTPPTVDAGGPYAGLEGTEMLLSASAFDLDGDALTYSWTYSVAGEPGITCEVTGAGSSAATLTLRCDDDAVITATITVNDGVNTAVQSSATLVVGNVAPVVGALEQSSIVPNGSTVAIELPFSDPGSNDTHTATVDWGDGSVTGAAISESAGNGTVSAAHLFAVDGEYTVVVTLNDDDGGTVVATRIVISDTTAPLVASTVQPTPNANGWNNSPVTVGWDVTDSLTPIDSRIGCDPVTRSTDTSVSGVSFTCTATSAGGSTSLTETVKLDQVAPNLSGVPTTAANGNGWYSAPVTIDWSCDDALSGINGSCPADSTLNSEGAAVSASASIADNADNNTNTTSDPVKIDLHAPTTSALTLPEWNNATVTVLLAASDGLSGVDVTRFVVDGGGVQSGSSVLLADEGVHSVEFWSVDFAGNVESSHVVTVRIDRDAPSIVVSQSPVANGAGWNNGDVTVSFVCGDTGSGVASCSSPEVVSSEGAGQLVSGSAADVAGNVSSASTTVNLDKTAPSISGVVPVANANGWFNSPVSVSFVCSDALSGVASCPASETLSVDGAAQSVSGTAVDAAGNTRSATASGINIDQTPPTLTAVLPSAPLGWYNGPITVQWDCSDNLSGVASCPGNQVVSAEGFTTLAETIVDNAGNETTIDVTVRIDETAPGIVADAEPDPNANGWNNTDVTVSFSCGDNLSGATFCSMPSVLHEGASQSVTGSSTDAAGNVATATLSGINIDKTAPVLSGSATSPPNANGWYNDAVSIAWSCSDALSGLQIGTCPADDLIAAEGVAQQTSATAFDLAGNATTATSPAVSIDLTAPTTAISAVPTAFTNTDVSITLTPTDNLSGVASTSYSINGGPNVLGTSVSLTTNGVHTLRYSSVDNAGNVETQHLITIRIDNTAPTINASQSPAPNGAGWNSSDVTVSFVCGDSLSGIASCSAPQTVTTEGVGQLVSGSAVDNAGNTAAASATVSIDKTAPTVGATLSAAANAAGWYRVPVAATFVCSDALSGVNICPTPTTFGQGAGQTATGTATDVAGNSGSGTIGPVNVDLTAPTITAAPDRAPDSGSVYTGPVTIRFTCSDALSGIGTGGCPSDIVVSTDGSTTVSGTATDRAGNMSTVTASFTLTVQSVRLQKQTVLIEITTAMTSASKHDRKLLKVARDAVAASINPSLWAVGNRLKVHGGVKVFEKERQAVTKLTHILNGAGDEYDDDDHHGHGGQHGNSNHHNGHQSSIPTTKLVGWITILTNADRVLAQTAIDDAIAANRPAGIIAIAQAQFAAADASRAAGYNAWAIQQYKHAWKTAHLAFGHHCGGGDEPDDY